ncbi:MAG: hypothetical protein K9J81_12225, partial [Desulfohalobiaceae bacterium]|nr:hypothetical protein [Desulfohalobiaceae bacterium]
TCKPLYNFFHGSPPVFWDLRYFLFYTRGDPLSFQNLGLRAEPALDFGFSIVKTKKKTGYLA